MIFVFDDFELDSDRLELRRGGTLLKADRTVLSTLACLARNAGRLVTKEELVEEVWGGRPVADTVITVATARLRKTLGQRRGELEFVENVYGRGYRFVRTVVSGESSSRPPPAVVDATVMESAIVGRERVLHRLRQALGQARNGRGRLCALMGSPGIGKTQVVEAFERELQGSEVMVTWGFCHELGDTPPLGPWQRALRPVFALLDPPELDSLGELANELRALLEGDIRQPAEPSANSPAATRYRLFEAASRAMALAAEKRPVVVVLDDLHCADLASLELLAQLVDELARTRLLIIATLRTGSSAVSSDAHLPYALGHRNCERVVLEPLSEADVARYVATVVDDNDGKLGKAVYEKSEGNPFYMTELTRQLADMERPCADVLAVPEAALELIRQRIAVLDVESRRMLSAAAVIGRSFELSVLQQVTHSEPSTLMAKLDSALGAEVLVAAPDSATAFAFGHELLRAALYDALSPAERRERHLATALALEERLSSGETVAPSALAFHFHRALPEGDPRKTVDYCRAAAAASSAVFANAEVARYMRHALEALDLMERPSVRLRMALLQAISMHTRTTDPAEFNRVTREIVRLAREHEDGPNLVVAGTMLNPALGLKPEAEAEQAHRQALAVLPPDASGLRAVSLAGLAATAPHCFDIERTEPLLTEAIQLSEPLGVPPVLYGVLAARLYLHGGPAYDDEEAEIRQRLEALARAHPRRMPVLPSELAYSRSVTSLQRGQTAATTNSLEQCISRCREIDQRETLWHAERALLLMRINAGGGELDAVSALSALHRRAEQQSLVRTTPFHGFDRAVVLAERGHPPTLDDSLRRALAYDGSEPPSIWSLKVRALATAGWVEAAHASLRAVAPDALAKLPCDRDYLGTMGHLARAALLLGARDYIEAIYPLLAPYPERFASHVSFFCEGSVAQLLGMLAAALGRRPEAIAHLQSGITLNERTGFSARAEEARGQLAACRETR